MQFAAQSRLRSFGTYGWKVYTSLLDDKLLVGALGIPEWDLDAHERNLDRFLGRITALLDGANEREEAVALAYLKLMYPDVVINRCWLELARTIDGGTNAAVLLALVSSIDKGLPLGNVDGADAELVFHRFDNSLLIELSYPNGTIFDNAGELTLPQTIPMTVKESLTGMPMKTIIETNLLERFCNFPIRYCRAGSVSDYAMIDIPRMDIRFADMQPEDVAPIRRSLHPF